MFSRRSHIFALSGNTCFYLSTGHHFLYSVASGKGKEEEILLTYAYKMDALEALEEVKGFRTCLGVRALGSFGLEKTNFPKTSELPLSSTPNPSGGAPYQIL